MDGPGPGDHELVAAVARREPAALTVLYDRYARLAFALAYRVLSDAAAAEEAVQDAFWLVWRHAASFDAGRGSVRSWLLTIVHHRAIDVRRSHLGRGRSHPGFDAVDAQLATPDLWNEVAATLEQERVRCAVDALPTDQRLAIELAYFEGLTQREIAERTGAPLGTVKGRLRLGLRKLHGLLVEAGRSGAVAGPAGDGGPV